MDGHYRTGQDVFPEMPYIHHIGYWRWQLGHCIEPQIQEPNPNVQPDLSIGAGGRGWTGQDRTGWDVFTKVAYIVEKFLVSH